MTRKLVTVRKIDSIDPIDGADSIEKLTISGWHVVAQKGIHTAGDLIVFFEIDSFLPQEDSRFESFMKFGTRNFEGKVGHRVKTKKLRGVYSQGVVMPLVEFPEITDVDLQADYSETLGIVKYEKQEVTGNCGDAKGTFPWFLRKSDQERLQNLYNKFSDEDREKEYVGTLKMDGSSCSVYYVTGERYEDRGIGYCSRNQELKIDYETNPEQTGKFQQGVMNSGLFTKVVRLSEIYGGHWMIQGELVGAGIQGNFEKFGKYQVFAYNIFDIEKQEYVDYNTFKQMAEAVGLVVVPEIYPAQKILQKPLEEIMAMADGKGYLANYREGLVWKQVDGTSQWKTISNFYLNKEV